MSGYSPTLCSTAESKDQFYQELDVAIGNIPKTEQLYILGDVNARVGADHEAWPNNNNNNNNNKSIYYAPCLRVIKPAQRRFTIVDSIPE